jgi:hypothetical protein
VSPFPGAATGSGGEIRDEGAVGQGSKPKAGLVGFSVSNLLIPGHHQPWETDFGKPSHVASSLDIMIEGPLGGAAFNNEFGRPALTGYFRTFAEEVPSKNGTEVRGYHKPIMIAGGLGTVRPAHILKKPITSDAFLVAHQCSLVLEVVLLVLWHLARAALIWTLLQFKEITRKWNVVLNKSLISVLLLVKTPLFNLFTMLVLAVFPTLFLKSFTTLVLVLKSS